MVSLYVGQEEAPVMAKQTSGNLPFCCQHRSQCDREAIVGLYRYAPGDTDVNLDIPARVYCGRHKPKLHLDRTPWLRNVKLRGF
jgi:hypothetical protein